MKLVRGPGRPRAYETSDGKRVPSVTTILNRFGESGGLIHWAWKEGCEGRDYRDTRDKAADAGSLVHEMIDADIHGLDPKQQLHFITAEESIRYEAEKLYLRFLDWSINVGLQVTHTELPLVSEEYGFGGTLDAVGYVNGVLSLLDWKKGTEVYTDYLVQIASYRQLWNEEKLGAEDRVDSASVILLGDEEVGAKARTFDVKQLDTAFKQFFYLRVAYDADLALKKMVEQ